MKKLRVFNSLGECYSAKSLLEGYGFVVLMKNEYGCNTVGAGPAGVLPFSSPELWLLNDEMFMDAIALLDEDPDFVIEDKSTHPELDGPK